MHSKFDPGEENGGGGNSPKGKEGEEGLLQPWGAGRDETHGAALPGGWEAHRFICLDAPLRRAWSASACLRQ